MRRPRKLGRFGVEGTMALAVIILLGLAGPAWAFPDVPAGHPYEAAIDDLADLGVLGGYSNGDFGPDDLLKRAQFAKLIVNTIGIDPGASTNTRFIDLGAPDANGYPHKYVQAAYDAGITNGTNAAQTLFSPWSNIRRDQVVTMIVRGVDEVSPGILEKPPTGIESLFSGVGQPHGGNLRIAEYNGLLVGLTGIGPGWHVTADATRGEVAQMLWNLVYVATYGTRPPETGEAWVYADGSGDFATLEEAVGGLGAGSTIHLGSGTFTLTDGIAVTRDLELVGMGSDGAGSTTISCPGRVVYVGEAALSAEGIDFVCTYTGNTPVNVVEAQDAEIDLTDCRFAGGNIGYTPEGDEYVPFKGNSLCIHGTTTGTVTGCVCTLNDHDGIAVDDDAQVMLVGNECTENGNGASGGTYGGCGISVSGSAVCEATDNTCDSNSSSGIRGNGQVEITAAGNLCRENGAYGITIDFGGGTITGNTCDGNHLDGILIFNGFSDVTIEGNNCSHNGEDGIDLYYCVSGVVRNNTCSYNGANGVEVGERHDGAVTVSGNTCLSNTEAGIRFDEGSAGTADNNECAHNKWGIYVDSLASATVGTNSLHDNAVANLYRE
jgi:parallel beta-helix repeat protein